MAQESIIKKFMKMHFAEQWWVATHPFVARKAHRITQNALEVTSQMLKNPALDGDANGGQVDAFRHCFWMASLAQQISPKTALKLGKAHEKGNYRDFRKRQHEEGTLPDSAACEMDLRNNEVGVKLGAANKKASQEELMLKVQLTILNGELWVIKKDTNGEFLDWQGKRLETKDYQGKWITPKCLVPSNFKAKK